MSFTNVVVSAGKISSASIGVGDIVGLVACLVTHDDANDTHAEVRSEAPFEFVFSGVMPGQYEIHIHGVDNEGRRVLDVFKTAIVIEEVIHDSYAPQPQRIELVNAPDLLRVELI